MTSAHIKAVAAEVSAISGIESDPIPTSSSRMIEMGAAARNHTIPQFSPRNRNGTNKHANTTTHAVIAIFLAATDWDLAGCNVILSPIVRVMATPLASASANRGVEVEITWKQREQTG